MRSAGRGTWARQSKPTHAKAFGAGKVAKLTKDDAKPKVVWRRAGGPLKDYAAFLDALRTGKLDDRLDYAY